MTNKRMALVPREVTKEIGHALESNIAECLPPSPVHAANWRDAWGNATAAAPNGGKVSREDFGHVAEIFAPYIICTKANCADMAGENCLCGKEARAVIAALGLEVEA